LWIKIDKQNAMAQLRQCSAEIYGRGRLSDAAFLIGDRNDFHLLKRGMDFLARDVCSAKGAVSYQLGASPQDFKLP
jgi:hypothetical protein